MFQILKNMKNVWTENVPEIFRDGFDNNIWPIIICTRDIYKYNYFKIISSIFNRFSFISIDSSKSDI